MRGQKMFQGLRVGVGSMVAVLLLIGCTTTGFVTGSYTAPGTSPTPVTFRYQTQPVGTGGTMTVTLPRGESFSGKYVQITSTTTADTLPPAFWDDGWPVWGPFDYPWYDGPGYTTFVRNYSGKVVATLFGDRGDTMRCRFKLSVPEEGMRGGGVGDCQVSNGGQLTAQF
jgi:hypothetical protein